MDACAQAERDRREAVEQRLALQERVDELGERLANTITEEDWLEAKEEPSSLRDRISKLNEKYEALVGVNTGHGRERRRRNVAACLARALRRCVGRRGDNRRSPVGGRDGGRASGLRPLQPHHSAARRRGAVLHLRV